MDNPANESSGLNGQQSAESALSGKRPLDQVISAVRTGAEDARKAAEEAFPKIKDAACSASYWAAYGVSFAASFQWNLIKAGGRDGIKTAKEAAQQWLQRVIRGEKGYSPSPVPPLIGPPTDETRPTIA